MKKEIIFELKSIYRDNMRINGLHFGSGEKSACIVGGIRGNELQQVYICANLAARLKEIERQGKIAKGKSILVISALNPYSINIEKRFWPTDNTDINRMFPGYSLGETTQRIAAGIFEAVKDFKYGIHFTSNYIPGSFVPNVRMMHTGYEDIEQSKKFGLPYIILRKPRPYDTTTLNYNWQLWNTQAYSIFTKETSIIDRDSAGVAVNAVLRFLANEGIIDYDVPCGIESQVIDEASLINVKSNMAGFFDRIADIDSVVAKGQILAQIIDPCDGSVKKQIKSPVSGRIFFAHSYPISYANSVLFKIIPDTE